MRQVREELRDRAGAHDADDALVLALNAVRTLEIPHLEPEDGEDQVVH